METESLIAGPLTIIEQERDILPRAFRYIIEHNSSNYAPYHNFNHMLRVMYYCNKGCRFHRIEGKPRINVLLAAIFHDFDHSQGEYVDSHNIIKATDGVKAFYESNPMNKNCVNIEKVVEIIQATQYPYVIDSEDLTMGQGIIRDADLMPSLDPDWMNNIIVGLMKEMKINSFKAMAEGQIEFHKNIKMCTPWGRHTYDKDWWSIFENLEKLRGIL